MMHGTRENGTPLLPDGGSRARWPSKLEASLESPSVVLLRESDAYWPQLRAAVEAGRIGGSLVLDARIAALCALHGVKELWTADRDFGRFPGLAVIHPLAG